MHETNKSQVLDGDVYSECIFTFDSLFLITSEFTKIQLYETSKPQVPDGDVYSECESEFIPVPITSFASWMV